MKAYEIWRSEILNKLNNNIYIYDIQYFILELFQFQAFYNSTYREYLNILKIDPITIKDLESIPFLPIQFFKARKVQTGHWNEIGFFESSTTTSQVPSRHYYQDLTLYESFALFNFKNFLRRNAIDPDHLMILGYLPGYVERGTSSLVWMVRLFIEKICNGRGGIFTEEKEFNSFFEINGYEDQPVLIWGVTHALLQLQTMVWMLQDNCYILETGGMKGMNYEISKRELHQILGSKFQKRKIFSEYGMTELFSQAYQDASGIFIPSNMLQVYVREINDPLGKFIFGKRGVIHCVDFCNLDSCAFILTEDVGIAFENSTFSLLGRLEASEARGCNLLGI